MHAMNVILSTVYVHGLVQDGSHSFANEKVIGVSMCRV